MEDNAIKPNYYKSENGKFQVFDVIEEFNLDFFLGNVVKYVCRAGKKRDNSKIQDLRKAKAYIEEAIARTDEKGFGEKILEYQKEMTFGDSLSE